MEGKPEANDILVIPRLCGLALDDHFALAKNSALISLHNKEPDIGVADLFVTERLKSVSFDQVGLS